MTLETFQRLVEAVGLPIAMLITAVLAILTAWLKGWLVSRRDHEAIVAEIRERHKAIEDELRSRAERGEKNAEYWQGAWSNTAGLARETQEVVRTVVREPRR